MELFLDLTCTRCESAYPKDQLWNLSPCCEAPLFARYDLRRATQAMSRDALASRPPTLWRYAEVLPVENEDARVSLGEGFTPLLHVGSLGKEVGLEGLYLKEEGNNPTGSFKARGMSVAISRAVELGESAFVVPSAGNAGSAAAAYAARAGVSVQIFMPKDTPVANRRECLALGAQVEFVDGLITDCGRIVAERKGLEGWFDLSTLKEPYRVEGKKTMGYELAEQFAWTLPDVVIYPTGGGTGLIGMWKAFDEMEKMGWIGQKRPKMISVQAAGCAPIVRAFEAGADRAEFWKDAHTLASGLRVPAAVADFLMLRAIRESRGAAISVTDDEILQSVHEMASATGVFPCPEGAASLAGLKRLMETGFIRPDERVVLFNTGSGLKYLDVFGEG